MRLGRHLLGMLLVVGIGTACASIMGVEDAELDGPPGTSNNEGGPRVGADGAPILADGGVFDPDTGCVGKGCPCTANKDCLDKVSFTVCVDGKCGVCTTKPVDSCPAGRLCAPPSAAEDGGSVGANPSIPNSVENECIPGCKSDDDCKTLTTGKAPFCLLQTRQCVACRTKADCGPSQQCTPSGKCADPCTTIGGPCGSGGGQLCCDVPALGALCIGVQDDSGNCGDCGKVCNGGGNALCCDGKCENRATSVNACGGCGIACSKTNGTPSCSSGNCTWRCNSGFHHCQGTANTGCETNTSDNTTQCGSCSNDCNLRIRNATGIQCTSSQCDYGSCNASFEDCNTDNTDGCECACGAVGQTCCTGSTRCNSGLVCNSNVCGVPCGATGEACCNGTTCDNGHVCNNGGICERCGDDGQPCCASSSCTSPLRCVGGTCRLCHPPGQGPCEGTGSRPCCSTDCSHGQNKCKE